MREKNSFRVVLKLGTLVEINNRVNKLGRKLSETEKWACWSKVLISEIMERFWRAANCKHPAKFVTNEDWAGPDSGGYGFSCSRCGYSWSKILY